MGRPALIWVGEQLDQCMIASSNFLANPKHSLASSQIDHVVTDGAAYYVVF